MTVPDHDAHPHDVHDADRAEDERTAVAHESHVHSHADGTTHAHPPHRHAKRPGFLARLFGAPG